MTLSPPLQVHRPSLEKLAAPHSSAGGSRLTANKLAEVPGIMVTLSAWRPVLILPSILFQLERSTPLRWPFGQTGLRRFSGRLKKRITSLVVHV